MERYSQCDSLLCRCPNGRKYNRDANKTNFDLKQKTKLTRPCKVDYVFLIPLIANTKND
jgi:hypothetical protein